MDLQKLKSILIEQKILVKETSKNFLCVCPYCGDHPNPKKRGHLYVSKNPSVPVAHCFYGGCAKPIPVLIFDITGDTQISQSVISKEELERTKNESRKIKPTTKRFVQYKLPELHMNSFPAKRLYLKKRSANKLNISTIPNLIFSFGEFFNINQLDIVGENKVLGNWELDYLHSNFVGFLGRHHSTIYCRNIDRNAKFAFRKIPLQHDPFELLDYWSVYGNDPNSKTIVLAEGIFDIIGEYVSDSLNIRNDVRLYASGNSYSYSSLLKSVCFDENLFKADVIILSDQDKKPQWYNKFKKDNEHIIKSVKIYGNRSGKDFGVFPQIPFRYI